jgi:hypothetical protein
MGCAPVLHLSQLAHDRGYQFLIKAQRNARAAVMLASSGRVTFQRKYVLLACHDFLFSLRFATAR